ncbi:MAG: preprotein translocase subunit YajC [Anaerolineae bacterium]|jgi:preprotein translocase subunit YajC|nr:preprotein translocase subunit YajC [Anaerolineae bacterium]
MPTGQAGDWTYWIIVIVALGAFLVLPQFMARRRQKRREQDLRVGDTVMTIGGFLGRLTSLDLDANVARIELAEGVEVRIVPGAISGKRQEPTATVSVDDGAGSDT